MTLDELMEETRERARDTQAPYFASDAFLKRAANQAVLEACERSPILYDSTSSLCSIAVGTGVASYRLHPSVRIIDKARIGGKDIAQATEAELDLLYPGGWTEMAGEVDRFVRRKSTLRLFRIPTADQSLGLCVYRRPLDTERMESGADEPAVPEQYHMDLVYWMLHRVFSLPYIDISDSKAAADSFALFESRFGRRKSARFDQYSQDTPTHAKALPTRFV